MELPCFRSIFVWYIDGMWRIDDPTAPYASAYIYLMLN